MFLSRSELTPLPSVGASLLAKNFQTPRTSRMLASSVAIFASKLAPTVGCCQSEKCLAGRHGAFHPHWRQA
ncbi:hypothetical protein BZ164_04785 [Pseudomonas veronii]|nr:hypothetical protein BZ164_04785 [Pseudomonas veronii]RTY80377.1 hypothetical protein EKA83_01020 [Pseudomonas veronii]